MAHLAPDIRYALRSLRKRPGYALVVALTLALGLGLNASVFGILDAMLMRPFQFEDYQRLVILWEQRHGTEQQEPVAPGNFLDWRREARAYERLEAWQPWDAILTEDEQSERLPGFRVTPGFFELLGIAPAAGRFFLPDEGHLGEHRRVVIGDGLWRQRFGGALDLVGREISIQGEPHTVVGIAPRGFDFPLGARMWSPLVFRPSDTADRTNRSLVVGGKLRDTVHLPAAQREMDLVSGRLEQAHPETNRGWGVRARSLSEAFREGSATPLVATLQSVAALVLVVACANIAGLLLARAFNQRRELALRSALGASRGRLLQQVVIETVVLSLLASAIALPLTWAALEALRSSVPADMAAFIEGWNNLRLDARLVVITPLAAIVVGLVVGLIPALGASRVAPAAAMKEGERSSTGKGSGRGRQGLVVAEIAFALALLVTAGLAASGATRLANQPTGFVVENLLTSRIALPDREYETPQSRRALAEELLTGVEQIPAVEGVAVASILPAAGYSPETVLEIEGRPALDPALQPRSGLRMVSPGFFSTLHVPIVAGRAFSRYDGNGTQPVAIVSATAAKRFWPGEDPLGRRLRLERPDTNWLTVVGVAGDVRRLNWWDGEDAAAVYLPWSQAPASRAVFLAVRTRGGEPTAVAGSIRAVLGGVDPLLAPESVLTMREAITRLLQGMDMLGSFIAVAGAILLSRCPCSCSRSPVSTR